MLEAVNLSCERHERVLFSSLNFSLSPGQMLRVRGPNGSGKSTLLRILVGLYLDYEGTVEWSRAAELLYLGHAAGVNGTLTAAENLNWLISLAGAHASAGDIDEALYQVGLAGYEDTPCHALSEGQRKRVGLARLAGPSVPVWILDEPLASLDVQGIDWVRSRLDEHLGAGGVAVITSHQDLGREAREVVLGE